MVDYKNRLCQERGIPDCKVDNSSITEESFQVSHLKHFYTAHKILKSEKVQTVFAFEEKQGTCGKQKCFTSGLKRWICFILLSKLWLDTKQDRMCPNMLCVWVPPFITSNTPSAHCQYSASSLMQLNSLTVTSGFSPGATASDLLSSCILSHLGAHHHPHCCAVTSCLAIFVILEKAVPVRWYLCSIHRRTL